MTNDDNQFIRSFFKQLRDEPLLPDDPRYVDVHDRGKTDPIDVLHRGITFSAGQSVHLLSGFRGTGKSTELRRLKARLEAEGYFVALIDISQYINLSSAVDVSDFLTSVVYGFSEALERNSRVAVNPRFRPWYGRFYDWLKNTNIEIPEIDAAGVTISLRTDPTFRQMLQEKMAGHLGTFLGELRSFIEDSVQIVRNLQGTTVDVVLLVDSVEQIRGTSANEDEVHRSVERLFAVHAEQLHLPSLHVVYTIPPYAKVLYQGLSSLYGPSGMHILPSLKVRDAKGQANSEVLDVFERILSARGDWMRLLGSRSALDHLSLMSGGQLREFLQLVASILLRVTQLPASESIMNEAIDQYRSEFLPIADRDAEWLARVAETHEAALTDVTRLPDLARFLDTHLILCYQNGKEWYDVHPLISETVREQVKTLSARRELPGSVGAEPDT